MKRRTVEDIDEEIDDIELEILKIKESIHKDEPDWRELHRRKTGDLPTGYLPLADRRKTVKLLENKIARLNIERQALSTKQSQSSGKKFGYGELKKKIGDLAKRDGYKTGSTVPSSTVAKWRQEIENEGYKATDAVIRAKLSDLVITKERPKKK